VSNNPTSWRCSVMPTRYCRYGGSPGLKAGPLRLSSAGPCSATPSCRGSQRVLTDQSSSHGRPSSPCDWIGAMSEGWLHGSLYSLLYPTPQRATTVLTRPSVVASMEDLLLIRKQDAGVSLGASFPVRSHFLVTTFHRFTWAGPLRATVLPIITAQQKQ